LRIDGCTRIRVLRIYDRLNQKTAIQFASYLPGKLPFRVEAIQTDNGSKFQSAFHWHRMDGGIRHIYIKPCPCHDWPSSCEDREKAWSLVILQGDVVLPHPSRTA
jgi:hypothetical protein